jgi:DNA-binding transcriptional regulator YdaS (Cro superfamily)
MRDCTTEIVTKAQFARLSGVSPARVSQWLAAGKIGPEALVGKGPSARIDVAVATEHLRERLDPSQRFGANGLSTRLDDAIAAAQADTVESRMKAEKLRQAELITRRAEEQDRLSRGVYILARDAMNENLRTAAKLLEGFEGSLADFAAALASQYRIPVCDALHLLRSEMRSIRERMSSEYFALAAVESATIEDPDVHQPEKLQ